MIQEKSGWTLPQCSMREWQMGKTEYAKVLKFRKHNSAGDTDLKELKNCGGHVFINSKAGHDFRDHSRKLGHTVI